MTTTTFDQSEPEDDIVKELRTAADTVFYEIPGGYGHIEHLLKEAADEIERLRRVLGMTRN